MKMLLSILSAAALVLPTDAHAADTIHKGDVVVVPLRGEISLSLLMFLRRAEKLAESNGAAAIIFEMNTYGGRLDAAEEITNVLNRATIPTYTFINTNAGSAGALIALATQHIWMAPVSAIGAAAPVLPTGEDVPLTERDKTISYFSALIRSSAKKNGHNEDIGEAFMNKDKEVKIGDRVIHPKGTILTLNAQEAAERIGGKASPGRGSFPRSVLRCSFSVTTSPGSRAGKSSRSSFWAWCSSSSKSCSSPIPQSCSAWSAFF